MKKLFKPLSLLLAALLAAGSMVACSDSGSDELPTPEEIFDLVEKAKDAKITMEMEISVQILIVLCLDIHDTGAG